MAAGEYRDWGTSSSIPWDADIIDLDDLPEPLHKAIKLHGQRLDLANGDDLSLADQENLRRLFVKIWEIENATPDEDGLLAEPDAALLERLDKRTCQIALFDTDPSVIDGMSPKERNIVRNAFFKGFDVSAYTARMVGLWMEQFRTMRAEAEATVSDSEPPTKVSETTSTAPLKKGKTSRRGSASGSKAA